MKFNCEFCGNPYDARPSANRKYCSRKCYGLASVVDAVKSICPQCNKGFEWTRAHKPQKYCSRKCQKLGIRKNSTRVCEECGIEFPVNWVNSKRKYCSLDCNAKAKDMRVKTNCPTCGKKMLTSNYDIVKGETNYCSRKCYGISRRNKIVVSCLQCGKDFKTVQSEINRGGAKYCSKKYYLLSPSNTAHGHSKGGKRKDLGDIYFRSSWEANFARYLNHLMGLCFIKGWTFEKEVFDLGAFNYVPDFKIESVDGEFSYHEVKGYMTKTARKKIALFKELYPNKKFVLVDEPVYLSIAKIYSDVIPNWELDSRGRL